MARIRTIKPDSMQHRKVGKLSDRAFRIWIGLLTQADDEGRLPCEPDQVMAWFFAYRREVSVEDVEKSIQEISKFGLIHLYSVNGTRYAYFPSWGDHQVINKPRPSSLPSPSGNDTVSLPENYGNVTGELPGEWNGMEWNGREGSNTIAGRRKTTPVSPPPPEEIFLTFPTDGKIKEWNLTKERMVELKALFPNLDVEIEVKKDLRWLMDNPDRRKTAKGMPSHIMTWLGNAQNRGGQRTNRMSAAEAAEEEERRIAREYREAQRDERKRRQELAAESSDKAIDTEG